MERRTGSGIMISLLLVGTLVLMFNVQNARSESSTIVIPDDYPTIQAGINAASNGDTVYIKSGTYLLDRYGTIMVNKSVSLVGENKENTIIVGFTIFVIQVTVDNVTITGLTFSYYMPHDGIGIGLSSVRNTTISGNKIVTEAGGVILDNSSNNKIEGNRIRGSGHGDALDLNNSPHNTIVGNTITDAIYGISLTASPNNLIDGNIITGRNIISIDSVSNNILIRNNTVSGGEDGISSYSSNIRIVQNLIADNFNGVTIVGSNVSLVRNNITGNSNSVAFSATNSCIVENRVTDGFGGGIAVGGSSNTVTGNSVMQNLGNGIFVGGHSNVLSRNNITGNENVGIQLGGSSNIIVENDIAENWIGISLDGGSNNRIYHNNFRDNVQQFYSSVSSSNVWDDGYPSGGNYWSDFTVRYPDAHELDDSGIWDTQYVIDENNRDRYPLISLWAPPPIPPVVAATVDIDPDTLNLRSRGQWITVYVQLPEGYNAADINSSTILLNGTLSPVLNPEYPVDHNCDGILEKVVKFDRATVESWIYHDQRIRRSSVALNITGELLDGTLFKGYDTIRVDYAGDANNDGVIDIADFAVISAHWYPGPPIGPLDYESSVDFNKDGKIDIIEVATISANWGPTVPSK